MSLTGRVIVLPDWVAIRVEDRINAQTNVANVSLSRVELGVSPEGLPKLRMVDMGIRDRSGLEVARLNTVEGSLYLRPLLAGQIEPARLSLSGAQVTVRRRADGTFDLSLGQGVGASGELATVLDQVDSVFTNGILSEVEALTAEALTITLDDTRTGRIWQVTDGHLTVTHDDDAVEMSLAFDVFNQTEELAETVLGFYSKKDSSAARLTASFKNALSTDIAAQSPLMTFLGIVDAPISGALHTVIDESGAVADLAGTLEFGQGTLSPDPAANPVPFKGGKLYVNYDPERERMDFAEMSLSTEWGQAVASGHAYMRGWSGGWPTELIGQIEMSEAELNPPDLFEDPITFGAGSADFRMALDPFVVDFGHFNITHQGKLATGTGRVSTNDDGWVIVVDAHADKIDTKQITTFWPIDRAVRTRKWTAENLSGGVIENVTLAWRKSGSAPADRAISAEFFDVDIHAVKHMVPIESASGRFTIDGRRLSVSLDKGILRPRGQDGRVVGVLDAAGTTFVVPKTARRPKDPDAPRPPVPAWVDLSVSGPLPAALYLLDDAPFRIFKNNLDGPVGPDMASGQVSMGGRIDLAMQPKIPREAISYNLSGKLSAIKSDQIVAGRALALPQASISVTNTLIEIDGRGTLSGIPVSGRWSQVLADGKAIAQSSVTGKVAVSTAFLDAFSIGLPKGTLSGTADAQYTIRLEKGTRPRMSLSSDLVGAGLRIPALGWSKRKAAGGKLQIEAQLGKVPQIDAISLSASGLKASGKVRLSEGGGFRDAVFDRVVLGGWLDAPVTLRARGAGKPVDVSVIGGTLDLRKARLGAGKGGAASGAAVPISLSLDQLIISEGIQLRQFVGQFQSLPAGLDGTFRAQVGRGPTIMGRAAPQSNGTAFRITSGDAGGVLKAAGVFKSARKGNLELVLAPSGSRGSYNGKLEIKNIDVHNAPAMAELLSAISVIGLLQQLGGQGIPFTDVDANFRLDPEKVTIYQGAASGPSMGISMDGYYYQGSQKIKMQGVISPFYVLNAAGRIFARKGEGLVGFNYTLDGTADDPKVSVNPLSLLTPGIFRDIFRRAPPPRPSQ